MDRVLRVLVVDDSAYVRKVVKQMLSRSPFLEVVGTARDGVEALELVEQLEPDVLTLDLMMPRMDGVTFLREQARRKPIPAVIVSITSESGELMLQALEAGAVDVIQKPTALASEKVFEIADELVEKVKAAAGARPGAVAQLPVSAPRLAPAAAEGRSKVDLIALGISTGGPQALRFLIPQLPADLSVPVVVVLHMPEGYTELFAKSLAELSRLEVAEARQGDPIRPGRVLIARAGRHLTLARNGDGAVSAHLQLEPSGTPHRPSVDVLFRSAAQLYGPRVLGVVMSGMGCDGKEGAAWIKSQGGHVWTEAEETCVVYGMPRSVVEAGLSDRSIPLNRIGQAILEFL